MNLKRHVTLTAMLAITALANGGTAVAQDAHERSAGVSGQAAIQYFIENERATLVKPAADHAIEYFRANELATAAQSRSGGALAGYVDGPQRSEPLTGTSRPGQAEAVNGSGFDWGSAAVGASSALMLALLVGVSLVTVRRARGRPLAH